jgi:hypothetical protein
MSPSGRHVSEGALVEDVVLVNAYLAREAAAVAV